MTSPDSKSTSPHTQPLEPASDLEIGLRLRLIRELFGFSQRELAKRAGVTNSSISMVEQGLVSPSLQSLSKMLAALPVDLADFFRWNPRETSSAPGASQGLSLCNLAEGESTPFRLAPDQGVEALLVTGSVNLHINHQQASLASGASIFIPPAAFYRISNRFQGVSCLVVRL